MSENAASTEMAERRELWGKHNELEATRPLILCDPENVVEWCRVAKEEAQAYE